MNNKKKYRLVKETINFGEHANVNYIIEKKILWWWSRNYLFEGLFSDSFYSYYSLESAIKRIKQLNKEIELIKTEIIEYNDEE